MIRAPVLPTNPSGGAFGVRDERRTARLCTSRSRHLPPPPSYLRFIAVESTMEFEVRLQVDDLPYLNCRWDAKAVVAMRRPLDPH